MSARSPYTPSDAVLEKYADVIVRFGLHNREGKRLKKGSVIQCIAPEAAKPLYFHLIRAILKAGYHPLGMLLPSNTPDYNFDKSFFDLASNEQLDFFAKQYHRGLIDQIDGSIYIIAETNPHALREIDPKKVLRRSVAMKQAKDWKFEKIDAGNLNWTLALYGTEASAKETGMSLRTFWDQIINACYLDSKDPVAEWKRIDTTVQRTAAKLTDTAIESVHMKGADMDLTIGIGSDRKWLAGGGNNIPSYEVFTAPHAEKVDGWMRFNQPHYRYGKKIDGIELWFKDGKVIKAKAKENQSLLMSMLKTAGGNRLGEFSLTDSRLSRITKFMAETLYDENMGGRYGNTHVALGSAYRACFKGKKGDVKGDAGWKKRGYNNSIVHSDLVSTTDRTVTATFKDGSTKVIYEDGKFTF